MRSSLRIFGIFLLDLAVLFITRNMMWNLFPSAELFLTSPNACLGYVVVFGPIIALSIGAALLACVLFFLPARTSSIWAFTLALAFLDAITAAHMKLEFCS
jgi:hypothetical protein